jgi:hypothetical protein
MLILSSMTAGGHVNGALANSALLVRGTLLFRAVLPAAESAWCAGRVLNIKLPGMPSCCADAAAVGISVIVIGGFGFGGIELIPGTKWLVLGVGGVGTKYVCGCSAANMYMGGNDSTTEFCATLLNSSVLLAGECRRFLDGVPSCETHR